MTRARDIASALCVDGHSRASVDVTAAAIEAVCSRKARAMPMNVLVGLNVRRDDDDDDDDDDDARDGRTYDDASAALIYDYVEANQRVFAAFAATAHVVEGKGTRCSKFARGASEDDVAKCAAWRRERMDEGRMRCDVDDVVRVKQRGKGDGRDGTDAAKTKAKTKTKTKSVDATADETKAKPALLPPAPAPSVPAWNVKPVKVMTSEPAPIARAGALTREGGTSLRDIMASESRRAAPTGKREVSTTKALAPKLPIITAELLHRESRRSVMDKFGKVRCQVCGRAFKAYDALEQHIGASHYGLNNPEAKVLEAAQIAAGIIPTTNTQVNRVSLNLGDLVSSKTKTSNSMVNSLATYFKTDKPAKNARAEGKEQQMIRSTNMATSTGMVPKRGKARREGKKKKQSTLKKIILRERTTRREEESKKIVEEEVEVEIEVRVDWVYVLLTYDETNHSVGVNFMCMDADSDDDSDEDVSDESAAAEGENADEQSVQQKLDIIEARAPAGVWGVRSLLDVLKGEPEPKSAKVKQETRTCDVCDVKCFGEQAWNAHVGGKLHAKKLAIRDDPEAAERAASQNKAAKTYVGEEGALNIRYAEQIITDELNEATKTLLSTLKRFQDRLYHTDKIKAKMRRRLLFGLREVAKSVDARTSKVVVIAPNIEKIESEGGLDDRVRQIIADAREKDVPVIFALTKRRIGKALGIQAVSIVSVLDYNGADEEFKRALTLAADGRALYAKRGAVPKLDLSAREFIPSA